MSHANARQKLRHRLEEVFREIGILLLVFVPIDFVLTEDTPSRRVWLLIFFVVGLLILFGALASEYRRFYHVD